REPRGDHLPLLILDGIGCSGWAFQRSLPILARHRAVVLLHYRGHGDSPTPPRPWNLSMDVLAGDAAALLDRIGHHIRLDRAAVLGFSMGFSVALELHRLFPERV